MKIRLISFTLNGSRLCKKIHLELEKLGYDSQAFAFDTYAGQFELKPLTEPLKDWTKRQFIESQSIIFIGASGIAVRAIAPYLKDKTTDPAVLVIDEKGEFVIPILSGHIGGANELALTIANYLGATPVITTATDINHKFAVDVFAKKNNLYIANMEYAKNISAAVLNDQPIGFHCEFDCGFNLDRLIPKGLSTKADCEYGICISFNQEQKTFMKTLNLIPRVLTLGIGCRKGKSFEEIEHAVLEVLKTQNLSIFAINKVATIDLKKEEQGLIQFCDQYNLRMETYSAETLEKVQGTFIESDYVKSITGIGNVCERAAILGSLNGTLILEKIAGNGVTVAIAMKDWSVNFE